MPWIKSEMESPVLPIDLTARNGEVSSFILTDSDRFEPLPCIEGRGVKLNNLEVAWWRIDADKGISDLNQS